MQKRLGDAELLDLVGEVMGIIDLDELRTALPEVLSRTIPSNWTSLNEVGPGRVVSLVHPDVPQSWKAKFASLAAENPIYQHIVRTGDGRAHRFSDVTSRAELERTRIWREFYRPLRVFHQMAFTLPHEPDHVLALVLNRDEPDFSDAERDFVNRARPFLIQAYRNAIAHTQARNGTADDLADTLQAHGLTPREAEVVRLVALGRSNRDVGDLLGVSERTVQKHLENAFRKLGVRSRSEASARAWELATSSPA